jgi:hypothetical protein
MTLDQMSTLKRWHMTHRSQGPLENHLWDALTCWVLGWMGVPASLVLWPLAGVGLCLALTCAPSLYVAARVRLHRLGRLRCDWLGAVAPSRPRT